MGKVNIILLYYRSKSVFQDEINKWVASMVTAWISHEDCLQHNTGDSHPEHSARLSAIIQRMEKAKFWPVLLHSQAPLASWQSIAAVHDQSYIQSLQSRFPAGKLAGSIVKVG